MYGQSLGAFIWPERRGTYYFSPETPGETKFLRCHCITGHRLDKHRESKGKETKMEKNLRTKSQQSYQLLGRCEVLFIMFYISIAFNL